MQHFQPPPANTSRYVYSELSCLSSRGKPSLPVEARARYELYKHRLEGTVSKYSHVLNGQPAKLGGRGGGKDLLSKPQVSRQKRISKCRSGLRADAIFGKTKHQLIWKTHMSQLAPRVLLWWSREWYSYWYVFWFTCNFTNKFSSCYVFNCFVLFFFNLERVDHLF